MIHLTINQQPYTVDADPEMPLLWVLRDVLGLTGTKYGCGIAQCGACTIHVEGRAVRSCVVPVAAVERKAVTTIEGLSPDGSHPVQQAWLKHDVPQCGYCQSGMIMAATGTPAGESATHGGGHRCVHGRQYLSLRHLRARQSGDPQRHSSMRRTVR
jgi:isoquinoline 1-oxidoreductase subunit alpha